MKGNSAHQLVTRTLAALVVASLVLFPLTQLATAATLAVAAPSEGAALTGSSSSSPSGGVTIPLVVKDDTFKPLPRGSVSPWDGEVVLDGIDGLSYNTPGTDVKVRAMSSNAFFVDEVWLVYPRVQYLFNNKDVQDFGGGFQEIAFSDWVTVGAFPQGTELIFGFKTGVGIDDRCQDRTNADGSVDHHHCYKVIQDPSFVPLAPDPLRVCALNDDACRNKAWPSQTPDGRSIFYTGPGVRNVKDNSPHGRFQFLLNDGFGNPLSNTALFGLEDVGAPLETAGAPCPYPPSPSSPPGCAWHPDFQDGGVVVWPALAATCSPTATAGTVTITGQPDYGTVKLRDSATGTTLPVTFAPGDTIAFHAVQGVTPSVTGVTPSYTVTLAGTAYMVITDPNAADVIVDETGATIPNPNKTLDAGICFDPAWPPVVKISASLGGTCATGWDFTITQTDAVKAPPSIRVVWTNDQTPPADEAATIPLTTIDAGGTAHYRSDLFTSLRVVSATATMDVTAWTGSFKLDQGPCPETKTADMTLACATGLAEWDITITDTTQLQAPSKVTATWKDGSTADVALSGGVDGGVAHYRTTAHLDQQMTSATAQIQGAWSGTFKVNGAQCPGTKTITAALTCALSSPTWDFAVSGLTTAPASITVTWAGGVTGTATLDSFADGVALYTTSANPTLTLTAASAEVAAEWSGTFTVAGGPASPCPPPPPPPGACVPIYNPAGKHIPNAGDNPLSGQNPDGFYHLLSVPGGSVRVKDTQSPYVTPAWPHGTTIKLTEANGRTPTFWRGPGSVDWEVRLKGDAEIWIYTNATGAGVPANKVTCYVPNPPKGPSPSPSTPPPSPSTSPSPSPSTSPGPEIHVKPSTLTDHECSSTEWHFVITQVTAQTAPASIHVYWANGQDAVIALEGVTGGTAHYRTTLDLDSAVIDATALIAGTYGQFNVSHGPCPATSPSPSPSNTPEPSPSTPPPSPSPSTPPPSPSTPPATVTVHVKTSTLTDHSCDKTSWHFVITNVTSATAPVAIIVRWTDGRQALVLLQSVTGGTAHYRTTQNLTRPVTDAIATIASSWVGQFNVSSGPCLK